MRRFYEDHFGERIISIVKTGSQNNEVYRVETDRGRRIMKLVARKEEADMEAAAEYYLPRSGLEFVVSGLRPDALEYDGRYCIVQEAVEDEDRDIGYWLHCTKRLHAEAEGILRRAGVAIRKVRIPSAESFRRRLERYPFLDFIDLGLFENFVRLITERENPFIHQDLRKKNLVGRCFVDFGSSGIGPPEYDLVKLLAYDEHGPQDPEKAIAKHYGKARYYRETLYISDCRLLVHLLDHDISHESREYECVKERIQEENRLHHLGLKG